MQATAKADVVQLLEKLPNDVSLEDIQYHLYVLEKIRKGKISAEEQGTLSHDEAKEKLSKWLS
ncbi:MAG: hypothetical protein CMF25_03500 [Kangiellaceae bacterium]|jgi:hypothetical protein|nr:hypothetical protein [Kangiellaceae bacterium]|tara:strand:+ start:7335 stop:7523 length:189 start_codon:yes stop_codon:yes gene_type:complete